MESGFHGKITLLTGIPPWCDKIKTKSNKQNGQKVCLEFVLGVRNSLPSWKSWLINNFVPLLVHGDYAGSYLSSAFISSILFIHYHSKVWS